MIGQEFEKAVKGALRKLKQATPKQILENIGEPYEPATRDRVRKILKESDYAEIGAGEIFVTRDDRPYKRQSQVWVYKSTRMSDETIQAASEKPEEPQEPSVDLVISPRYSPPPDHPGYRNVELIVGRPLRAVDIFLVSVTVLQGPIDRLGANIWINGDGPTELLWPSTQKTLDSTGKVTCSPSPKFLDFVAEQHEPLIVCWAARDETGEYLWFRTDTPLGPFDLKKMAQEKQYLEIEIQFIGKQYTDKERRKFRLNIRSWDELGLTKST